MLVLRNQPILYCYILVLYFLLSFDVKSQGIPSQNIGFVVENVLINGDQLNVNNITANINSNGRLFTLENQPADDTQPGFELKDVAKHSIHAAGLWIGGKENVQNQYRLMTPTFGQTGSDIFPGPVGP